MALSHHREHLTFSVGMKRFEEALTASQQSESAQVIISSLIHLAQVLVDTDLQRARALLDEALLAVAEVTDKRRRSEVLRTAAMILASEDASRAASLSGASAAYWRNPTLTDAEKRYLEELVSRLKEELGEAEYESCYGEGFSHPDAFLDAAVASAAGSQATSVE